LSAVLTFLPFLRRVMKDEVEGSLLRAEGGGAHGALGD